MNNEHILNQSAQQSAATAAFAIAATARLACAARLDVINARSRILFATNCVL